MSTSDGIFRRPFSVPQPTQAVGLLTILSLRADLAPPAFKAPTPLLVMYETFVPPFTTWPRPTQVAALATLALRAPLAPVPFRPAIPSPNPLLTMYEVFVPPFTTWPRPTQDRALITLTEPFDIGVISFPPWRMANPLLMNAFEFAPPFMLPRPTQGGGVIAFATTFAILPELNSIVPYLRRRRR